MAGCSGSCEWMWGHWWGLCGLGGALASSVCGSVCGVSGSVGGSLCGVSVGLCGDTKWAVFDLSVLPPGAGEGLRDLLLLSSCCSVSVPLCHFSPQRVGFQLPSPPALTSPASLREPGGSQAQGPCSVSSPRALEVTLWPGSQPFPQTLAGPPPCCAHPGGWGPGRTQAPGRTHSTSRPVPSTPLFSPGLTYGRSLQASAGSPIPTISLDQGPLLEQVSLLQ